MFTKLNDEQLRQICRTNIESLEKWARLFIHFTLSSALGADYFHCKNPDGNYKLKKSIIENADNRMKDEPGRFPTPLDTLFLEDIVYILCHQDFYKPYFSPHLTEFYPEGKDELRTFLNRLISVRNKLSHTNPFSLRDAERAVCYSNDFIDAVKNYFLNSRMEKEFNVPTVIKISDSLGNEYIPKNDSSIGSDLIQLIDPATKQPKIFYLGDSFSVTLEIDPSFPPDEYDINWHKTEGVEILENGRKITVTINNNLIGENSHISSEIVSHEPWHRFRNYDHRIFVKFKALPMPKK